MELCFFPPTKKNTAKQIIKKMKITCELKNGFHILSQTHPNESLMGHPITNHKINWRVETGCYRVDFVG